MRKAQFTGRAKGLALIAAGVPLAFTELAHGQSGCEGWQLVSDAGPGARTGCAAVFDNARGVTVLFGGYDGKARTARGDTWTWDGQRWTRVAETGPSPRAGHRMVYDSGRDVTVLYGGGSRLDDTWEWDGAAWTLAAQTGPGPRWSTDMAYDSRRGVTVLFGGYSEWWLGDTWEWDGRAWTLVAETGPRPRYAHAMAFDSARGVTVLFGGNAEGPGGNETWEWDGDDWRYVGVGPYLNDAHRMVFDDARGMSVLFGGVFYRGPTYGDTWEWTGGRQDLQLGIEATCPGGGPVRISWRCATPRRDVALFFAREEGSFTIPSRRRGWRPCSGVQLDLGASELQIAWHGPAGPNGSRTIRGAAPGRACGGYVQLLDLATCATSNVARVE